MYQISWQTLIFFCRSVCVFCIFFRSTKCTCPMVASRVLQMWWAIWFAAVRSPCMDRARRSCRDRQSASLNSLTLYFPIGAGRTLSCPLPFVGSSLAGPILKGLIRRLSVLDMWRVRPFGLRASMAMLGMTTFHPCPLRPRRRARFPTRSRASPTACRAKSLPTAEPASRARPS